MSKPYKLPSGAWRIRYFDADGKRQSLRFETYDLARSELRRLEVATDETKALRARDPELAFTVAQAFARYKAQNKRQPGETQRRFGKRWHRLDQHYRDHIEPHLADVLLVDLTNRRIRDWLSILAETKCARPGAKGRTLSAATITGVVTSLASAVKANDVPFQAMLPKSMRVKKRTTRPRAFQTIEEVRAFLRAAGREPWFKVAAAIACYAGARAGEVASLAWASIGTETIDISRSWGGPLKARYENGEDAARTVPLDPDLAEILAAWRKLTNGGPNDLVVLVDGTRPLEEDRDTYLAKWTRRICKDAKVTPITFHELRASFATITADQGLPVTRLSALLGHSNVATTARYIRPESTHAAQDPRARIGGHGLATLQIDTSAILN